MGSNSVKLQIVEANGSNCAILQEYKETLRIGDDCFRFGYITDESKERLFKALKFVKKIIELHHVTEVKAVGTAAFREAKNKEEITLDIKKNYDIDLDIISGMEEARLSYLAVSRELDLKESNALILDIGGGSAEFTIVKGGKVTAFESTPLGSLRLKNEFRDEISEIKSYIMKELSRFEGFRAEYAVCMGGSVNGLASVYLRRVNGKKTDFRINYVDGSFLKNFIEVNKNAAVTDMEKIAGVDPKKADIILPSAVILNEIINYFGLDGFYSFSGGLKRGLLIDILSKKGFNMTVQKKSSEEKEADMILWLTEIGREFKFDENHAKHVAFLSKEIFCALKEALNLKTEYINYLIAAAMLHDIGNFISFSKHHKHSFYLIKNIELPGYSWYERGIIANIARYHRKSLPKKSHDLYSDVKAEDIDAVEKLASILRLADALDSSHSGIIKNVKLYVSNKSIYINPASGGDISFEAESFDAKKDLMEKIAGKPVYLELKTA